MNNIDELRKAYPDWHFTDEFNEEREEKIKLKKARGKGAPKKRRSAAGMFISVIGGVGVCCGLNANLA
jgi:hypothetical protein